MNIKKTIVILFSLGIVSLSIYLFLGVLVDDQEDFSLESCRSEKTSLVPQLLLPKVNAALPPASDDLVKNIACGRIEKVDVISDLSDNQVESNRKMQESGNDGGTTYSPLMQYEVVITKSLKGDITENSSILAQNRQEYGELGSVGDNVYLRLGDLQSGVYDMIDYGYTY